VLTGAAAALASLGLLVAVTSLITRRYDRRKLRQKALQSASVSSGGILLQRDDDPAAAAHTGTGSAASFAASQPEVAGEIEVRLEPEPEVHRRSPRRNRKPNRKCGVVRVVGTGSETGTGTGSASSFAEEVPTETEARLEPEPEVQHRSLRRNRK